MVLFGVVRCLLSVVVRLLLLFDVVVRCVLLTGDNWSLCVVCCLLFCVACCLVVAPPAFVSLFPFPPFLRFFVCCLGLLFVLCLACVVRRRLLFVGC